MKYNRSKIIRVGDKVKVVDPYVFIRCGYPWNKEYVKRNVITDYDKERVISLMKDLGCWHRYPDEVFCEEYSSDIFEEIIDRLAYGILRQRKFGGKSREIYTEYDEFKLNKVYTVFSKRMVKTGTRVGGTQSGYEGEEYDSPHLDGEKTCVILNLKQFDYLSGGFEIEACNVVKLHKDYQIEPDDEEIPF